jgi:PAS domain S-box-containing protein
LDEIVFRTDAKGRWTYLNQAWEEVTHFLRRNSLGRSFLEFTHPDDRDSAQDAFDSLIRLGTGRLRRDVRFAVAGAGFRWAEATLRVVRGPDGTVQGTCGTLVDTTAHHEARESLRERERILRAILDHAPIGIWMQNGQGRLTFVNKAFCESVGVPEARFLEVPYYAVLFDPDTARNCMASDRRALEDDGPHTSFERMRFADGELHDVEIVKVRLQNKAGATEGLVGLSTDITQRKRAAEALRASEERFRALYDETPSMHFTLDRDGTILSVNEFGAGHLGYLPLDLVGRNVLDVFHPEDRAAGLQQLAECSARPGQVHHWQIRKRRLDGSMLWVRETCREVLREGRPVILVVCQDVTAAVLARQEKEALTAQLYQSQKLEAMGTLAGGIAHDFNNLLCAILSSADLAVEEVGEGHPSLASLKGIQKAGGMARDLVNQILTFSRPGSRQRKPIALDQVVADAVHLLRASLPASVILSSGGADRGLDQVWVTADPTQLIQVLVNLGTNAWHALEGRPGSIDIQYDLVEVGVPGPRLPGLRPGPYARLAVKDSGKGMSMEVQERIFEPFFTTKDRSRGTGLGLSIVHGILQAHEGAIEVESAEGEGTAFYLYFPACPPAVAAAVGHSRTSEPQPVV